MSDLIDRQAAIDVMRKQPKWNIVREGYKNIGFSYDDVMFTLEKLSPAQPQRKKGKWIKLDMHAHIADHKCTACGQECYVPTCMGEPMYTYCPNCGARMEGDNL